MRKICFVLLFMVFSVSSFADCTQEYQIKSKSRAKVHKYLKKAGIVVVGSTLTLGGAVALAASGGGFILVSIWGMSGTVVTQGWASDVEEIWSSKSNTYFKSLAVIEGAKEGVVPNILLDEIDKKVSYWNLAVEEQELMEKDIVDIINNANDSKELCIDSNEKENVLNFKQITRFVLSKLK